MSSDGNERPAVAPTAPKPYFCYQCDRTVSIFLPSPSSDLSCPICHGGFLEESQYPPEPNPNPFFSSDDSLSPFGLPLFLSASSRGGFGLPPDLASLLNPTVIHRRSSSVGPTDPDVFNPLLFLQNHLQTLMADGANIQFVIDGAPSNASLSSNLGDYFIGPGLEQLIQQLADNDPNRYGTPPASKSAIETLPDIKISAELLESDSAQCAVCMDMFELGLVAKQMPCKHIFHPDCILPWLALHNSCPVCRYELPTDDLDYEQRTRGMPLPENLTSGNVATDSGSTGEGSEQGDSQRTVERRFRISLPWPFRASGSPAETSSTSVGSGNNANVNEGETGSNSLDRGNQDLGSETRQEDLD
ncbi:E3 ubiquitin-protein ligase RING1-like [Magnolia sinica]|uniref:E3 ubiquitin-protein ligase RING1-like n=1 Tax=Magnolia sinica TaxID=86752 RepID=UPI00265A733C|nr:E3 ubiquitin-protein ligase RING1-like [Magnolia sinica]